MAIALTYEEQIERQIVKYRKQRNWAAVLYYGQQFKNCACESWEAFKNSWAGGLWLKRHEGDILTLEIENRFRW